MNDDPVPGIHRRPSIRAASTTTTLDVWKGVSIPDGRSEITLVTRNASGDVIRRQVHAIDYNNTVSAITIVEARSVLSSDGRTRPVVTLEITDRDGSRIHPGAMVNVSASAPFTFSEKTRDGDLVDTVSTTGIVDPDGLLRLRLSPARTPGQVTFSTQGVDGAINANAFIMVEDRPWVLVGVAEGTLSHQSISRHMRDSQETALGDLGSMSLDGRAALTAQGVIKGKWLITARYDSALAERDADFLDLDPEADYIVYADRSREGDLSASRHPLYLRIAGPSGEFLYGDFDTGLDVGQASYTRRLTGARALFGGDAFRVMGFAAETSQTFAEDRFAADGTTGPFDLSGDDILPYSEKISVEVSDRNLSSRVLSTRRLERGRDYDIDYRSGRIFLNDPLLSRDDQLNPQALVVSYEMDPEDGDGWVVGGRIEADVTDTLTFGVTAVREDNVSGSDGAGELYGADMVWAGSETLTFGGSLAMSRQDTSNTLADPVEGYAGDLRLVYDDGDTSVDAWVESRSTTFGIDNQDTEAEQIVGVGVTARTVLSRSETPAEDPETDPIIRTRALEGEYASEHNLDTGEDLTTIEGSYVVESGASRQTYGLQARRAVTDTTEGETLKFVLGRSGEHADGRLRFGLTQEVELLRKGEIKDPTRGLLEVEWDATERLTLRGTNEVAYSDDVEAEIVSLGAEYDAWRGATVSFGTLVAAGQSAHHTAGFAGLDQSFELDENTSLRFGVERQGLLSGSGESPALEAGLSNPRLGEAFTAWRAGFDRKTDTWTYGLTSELRHSDEFDQARLQALATRPLTEDLEAGVKLSLFGEDSAYDTYERDHEIEASLAWRPRDRQIAVLDQLRGRFQEDQGHREMSLTNILSYSRRLENGHTINLRHGLKYAEFGFATGTEWDVTTYLGAEYRHNITDTFDLGLHGSSMHAFRAGITDTSAGASIGVTPFDNGWISLGYNWKGYDSEDFQDGGYTAEGAFIQFRIKLDSASMQDLMQ